MLWAGCGKDEDRVKSPSVPRVQDWREKDRAGDFSPALDLFVVRPYSEKIDFVCVPFGTRSAPITTVIRAITIGYQRPE